MRFLRDLTGKHSSYNKLNLSMKHEYDTSSSFFFLSDSHGVTAYGLLENQYNAMYRQGCIFFKQQQIDKIIKNK